MSRNHLTAASLVTTLFTILALATLPSGAAEGARRPGGGDPTPSTGRSPELSVARDLADRRSLVVGDRFWSMGAQDGSYPATGFHTRGEMGGFWTPPIKLLDGLWFQADGTWLTPRKYTQRLGLPADGPRHPRRSRGSPAPTSHRTASPGRPGRAAPGLAPRRPRCRLAVDAHSELMKVYPWGETTPSQTTYNLPDTGSVSAKNLVFREQGTPPVPNAEAHDYAAVVGSSLTPSGSDLGPATPRSAGRRDLPGVRAERPDAAGPLRRHRVRQGHRRTAAVRRAGAARRAHRLVLGRRLRPGPRPRQRPPQRSALGTPGRVCCARRSTPGTVWPGTPGCSLPGDRLLQRSVEWSKQNLAESVQESRDLKVRVDQRGQELPGADRHRRQGTLVRRRLAGLPVAVRDGRGVHRLRGRQQRPVRHHQGPPARAARRQRRRQRAERQGRPRGHPGRPGLLRGERRRGQHRRDREVPLDRGAGLALDRRRRLPRRDVPLRGPQPALHLPRARRRRRRLAGGSRQRRDAGHGHGEAGQHRLHDPRPARPRRPGGQQGRHRDPDVGDRQGGGPREAVRRSLVVRRGHPAVRRLAARSRQRPRSSSGTGSG